MEIINSHDQFIECKKHYEREVKVIPTFSPMLNNEYDHGGIETGSTMVIMAGSHTGKTFFITNWMYFLMKSGYKSVFFSLDEESRRIIVKMLRLIYRCDRDSAEKILLLEKTKDDLMKIGFFDLIKIYEKRCSLKDYSIICETEKPQVVFIDHLMKMSGSGENVYKETREISEYLTNERKRLGIIYVSLLQLNKEFLKTTDKKYDLIPAMANGKGAGDIYENADVILSLARPDMSPECPNNLRNKIIGLHRKNRLSEKQSFNINTWNYDVITTKITDFIY